MTSRSEACEQIDFVSWFEYTYPGVLIFHVPNGEYRPDQTGEKLKKMGVRKFIPDLYIRELQCWIEVKKVNGKKDKDQVEMGRYFYSLGDSFIIGYGAEDAKRKLEKVIKSDLPLFLIDKHNK